MKKMPKISENFTLEDIRKIRDYNDELFSTMTWDEIAEYYRESAKKFDSEIEAIRRKRKTINEFEQGVSP
ncbi:MAG: hypothetical protein LBL87_05580 [Ruminococcus sp.]|jgi:hypothetical protein|nr:hypothetical protein [Ruminococcus sp.]